MRATTPSVNDRFLKSASILYNSTWFSWWGDLGDNKMSSCFQKNRNRRPKSMETTRLNQFNEMKAKRSPDSPFGSNDSRSKRRSAERNRVRIKEVHDFNEARNLPLRKNSYGSYLKNVLKCSSDRLNQNSEPEIWKTGVPRQRPLSSGQAETFDLGNNKRSFAIKGKSSNILNGLELILLIRIASQSHWVCITSTKLFIVDCFDSDSIPADRLHGNRAEIGDCAWGIWAPWSIFEKEIHRPIRKGDKPFSRAVEVAKTRKQLETQKPKQLDPSKSIFHKLRRALSANQIGLKRINGFPARFSVF